MELVYENVERVLDEVIDQANNLKGYANSQIAKVTDSINQALAAAQVQFPELSLTGITVTADGTLPPLPDAPTMPEIEDLPTSFAVPAFSPAIGGSGVDLSGAPVFTTQAPALNYPAFPAWQNVPMPTKPDATQYAVPDKPALAFGSVPELRALILPTLPTLTTRTFDAAAAELETALWERARERERITVLQATQDVLADFAARGFTIPPGALAQRLDAVRQKAQDNANTVSREIAIESAKLRIEGVKFAVTNCMALEELLWKMHEARMGRAFEAARLSVELPVTVFNALVSAFNARNQAYATQATVFRTLIEADMQELEKYRVALEGQKLVGELNEQDIRIMTALDARVDEAVKIYLGEIQAFEALQRTEGLKFDNWGKEIQAATALVNQQSAQYAALSEQVKGEIAKSSLFEAQVRAYTAEVGGFSTVKQLQIAELGAQNDALRTQYAAYQAGLQQQTSMAQQALARIQAATARYGAFTQQYVAEANVAETASKIEINQAELELKAFMTEIELEVKQADYTLKRLEALAGLQMKAADMIGQVGAQIAAQAVGAVRTSLSADGRAAVSANDNYNYSM